MVVVFKVFVIFVIENNYYSEYMYYSYVVGSGDIVEWIKVFGMLVFEGDGLDFFVVYDVMK